MCVTQPDQNRIQSAFFWGALSLATLNFPNLLPGKKMKNFPEKSILGVYIEVGGGGRGISGKSPQNHHFAGYTTRPVCLADRTLTR
jgi:hypothetical protein